jgi:multidrug efflux pump
MRLPELSVQRPVFTSVIALLFVAFGVMAFFQLTTREYPDISPAQISVSTAYVGAAADVVEKRITQPLEEEIGGIEGIRALRSSSRDGFSSINIEFELSRDIDAAANDVRDRVARASGRLPVDAERPRVAKADSDSRALMYISLEAEGLSLIELTDYAKRYVVDRFAVLPGVARVNLNGAERSMRVWIDRDKLSARELSISDITAALRRENVELPAGGLESSTLEFPVRVTRAYRSAEDFRALVVRRAASGVLSRLGDVARVEEGPEQINRVFVTNGLDSMSMGIVRQSNANTVAVLEAVRKELDAVAGDLPPGMSISTSGDASAFIRAAINGVYTAIALTVALVSLVIFVFLGNAAATLIPLLCIPISLLGAVLSLQVLGYSLNLISLLAMVLAIGLVVDDAIVVLENIVRRIESGEHPLLASARGAQQVGFAVITTTAVLLAVFSPVFFLQDATARLFVELTATIAFAVIVSSLMALSLVPMLCSKLLRVSTRKSLLSRMTDSALLKIRSAYEKSLRWFIGHGAWTVVLSLAALASLWPLLTLVEREYVPAEDQDSVLALVIAPEGTNAESMKGIIDRLQPPLLELQREGSLTRVLFISPAGDAGSTSRAFARISMVPADQRDYSAFELRDQLFRTGSTIPGARVIAFVPSGLGTRGSDTPVQFVIQGPDYDVLAEWRDTVLDAARKSGLFGQLSSDLQETQQQILVELDGARAASLGVSTRDVGEALQALLSVQEITTYTRNGEEYPVILQLERSQRASPADIESVQVRGGDGELIRLSNVLHTESRAGIARLERYNRLRAVTLSGTLAEGVKLGQALDFLEKVVSEELPSSAKADYRGESLNYKESGQNILFAIALALLVLYLVMAAQFESFVHPAVIMVTVPLALVGGLVGLIATGQTLNLFSQIGMLMLIGIATKNGILLVEFINQVRDEGVAFDEAIVSASVLRLRPVLMTTISTLMGAVPLVVMTGPGSVSRNVLGIVVLFGVSLATLFTLYLVPGLYQLIARRTQASGTIARKMNSLSEGGQ